MNTGTASSAHTPNPATVSLSRNRNRSVMLTSRNHAVFGLVTVCGIRNPSDAYLSNVSILFLSLNSIGLHRSASVTTVTLEKIDTVCKD